MTTSLRLDFQTFSGFTTTGTNTCQDIFTAAGQTGKNPPNICGTNTGYHSKFMHIYFMASMWASFLLFDPSDGSQYCSLK